MRALFWALVGLTVVLGVVIVGSIYYMILTPGTPPMDNRVQSLTMLHSFLMILSGWGAGAVKIEMNSKRRR